MLLEIALAAVAFQLLRHRKKWPKNPSRRSRPAADRSDALGAAGEALAQAKLRETLDGLCGTDYYLHDGPLVVEHAPGTAFPTAEIDHLAVTPFGIFLFETKNWSGSIAPSTAHGMLTRTGRDRRAEDRRSPLDQNRTKVAFFRARLPPIWPVSGAGLFTSPEARPDPGLHSDLLSLADLPHWMRARRDAFAARPPVDVARAAAAIAIHAQTSRAALEAHIRRVRI